MTARFDYFILLAEMRTGSNLLEAHLNALGDVACHGEAFNPHFIGYPKNTTLLGLTQDQRDADPALLIRAIRNNPGALNGFRFFHAHDQRILHPALDDPRCAKIILTRNPLDSYVSLKIARATQQWQLTNVKRRREAQVAFDPDEFSDYLEHQQQYQLELLNRLQVSGQAPFYINYDDLNRLDILNGLAAWLGVSGRLESLGKDLKPQNPAPARSKVTNPEQMESALSGMDRFNLQRTPNFEPRRGPAVSRYVAAAETPLLYLPVRGGPEDTVAAWLADLDRRSTDDLVSGRNQKQMRKWMEARPEHRKFTVLRHPLARAHSVFCQRILDTGPGAYVSIRNTLRKQFKLPIPGEIRPNNYDLDQHRAAFAAFLKFLRQNLSGQTQVRVDGLWCGQAQTLEGIAAFAVPDMTLREEELAQALPDLARKVGHPNPPDPSPPRPDGPFALSEIYDEDLETLASDAYQRDYLLFGFQNWKPL